MYYIGHIKKAHGIKGEVVYNHESDYLPEVNELLYIKMHNGDFRPFRIEQVKAATALSDSSFFVLFSGTASRTDAEILKGLMVYSETEPVADIEVDASGQEPTVFDCGSFTISDDSEPIEGIITGVEENPAHPLLIARIGTTELMIPAVDAYIVSIDYEKGHIIAQNLEALLEIASDNG